MRRINKSDGRGKMNWIGNLGIFEEDGNLYANCDGCDKAMEVTYDGYSCCFGECPDCEINCDWESLSEEDKNKIESFLG